ncbi:uncharacterized protein TNCV_1295911 [Trichonephila clavipes]|uniref:Uncharacterized protein n=1 Tax=Trichonephila clavipes TaxID=2585209 RepID=A0A8X6SLT2_TRICX|nr:uncharacterized protein TNCV_1295911 [Trichonephila clavipes]
MHDCMLPILHGSSFMRKMFGCCPDQHAHQISHQEKTSGPWLPSCGIVLKQYGQKKKSHLGNSTPSLGEFAGSKSALLRGLSIAFLSLIGTQIVPGSPQFGFRRTSRSPYRFSFIAEGNSQRLPQKSSLFSSDSLAPLISSFSYHPSPNHPSVISCSSAAPVGLSPLDL